MNYFSKPYNFLSAAGGLIFIFSLFTTEKNFNLYLFDTFWVIGLRKWLTMLAFVLIALWTIYKLLENILEIKWLTIGHAILSILAVALFIIPALIFAGLHIDADKASAVERTASYEGFMKMEKAALAAIVVFIIAQALLLGNIITGAVKHFRK